MKNNTDNLKQKRINKIRHSTSHVLAMSVMKIFPKAKLGIGPATEDGFYYDFELERSLTPDDLKKIQKIMQKNISQNIKFEHQEWGILKASNFFKKNKQPYKLEIIKDLIKDNPKLKKVSIYKCGDFIDLCAGPHVISTKEIKAFKLLSIAGAYWRGSEKNKMLQRIYGTSFETKDELTKYLQMIEEAKKSDHRILGEKLELFSFDEEVGPGLPLWMPKGAYLMHLIKDFAFKTYLKNGYMPVSTPHIANTKLWSHSGHLDFYKENLYQPFKVEKEEFMVKPMNCPFHVKMYKKTIHSYRDLPIRYTEMGTVYRFERSGVLHGLTRVRGFTQDDAHIICTKDQLAKELESSIKLTKFILKTFGFKEFEINISIRDPKQKENFIGSDEAWKKAEEALINAIKKSGFSNFVYDIGGAVFYGPKIDIKVADALGRKWQLSTIQVDFNLPEKFEMTYIDKNGKEQTPFMIHRALLGSLERFIGVLIEFYSGAFPIWLAPIQVRVLPISDKFIKYAQNIKKELDSIDIRVDIDSRSESIGKKIREAQIQKIPYMLIVGERELKTNKVSLRNRKGKDLGAIKLVDFIKLIEKEIIKYK